MNEQEIEYTKTDLWILNNVHCCACCKPLKGSKYINFVTLNKRARWESPTWGNIMIDGSHGRAGAYVCDACSKLSPIPVKFAVELGKDYSGVKYHLESGLVELPPIKSCPRCGAIGYLETNQCHQCNHTWSEKKDQP